MNRLNVKFAGLNLINPFLLASGPSARDDSTIREALKAGWAGVVTKSISFKPTTSPTPRLYLVDKADSLINIELISDIDYKKWSSWIRRLKKQFPKRVIIASIMGSTLMSDWRKLSTIMEESGADALELNVSCPHGMPERAMGSLIGQDKNLTGEVTSTVKNSVKIPVIVKLTPNVTDITQIATSCERAGADALSGINTVKSFAGIDINTLLPKLSVYGYSTYGGYGGQAIKPIALRCVSEMLHSVKLPVSAIGGVSIWQDAVEFLLLGASSVQVCTAAISYGVNIIDGFKEGLQGYLKKHKFSSVQSLIGKAKDKVVKFSELSLSPKQVSIINKTKCAENCEFCFVICRAAGYNAIKLDKKNKAFIKVPLCQGCGLCVSVCPHNAIRMKSCKRK